MSVKLTMPVFLQAFTNDKETVEVEGHTVAECLNAVIKIYPDLKKMLMDDKGRLNNYVGIYIDGQDAYPDELKKPVKDGDEVYVLYTMAGG
jgi:molybdopterin converting factor small subunit